jgi:CDP-glucose 4,6-dehydratase
MRLVLQGKTPVIRSNGLLKRDYVYVEDAVAALIAVGERLNHSSVQGRLFRVTTGTGTTVLEMVNHIVCAAGKPHLKPEVLNIQIEERSEATFYKPELEKQILGWFCRFSLKDGMSRTCQWYLEYFSKR